MAPIWRCDVPEAMTMKSAIVDLLVISITVTSIALSSARDASINANAAVGVVGLPEVLPMTGLARSDCDRFLS